LLKGIRAHHTQRPPSNEFESGLPPKHAAGPSQCIHIKIANQHRDVTAPSPNDLVELGDFELPFDDLPNDFIFKLPSDDAAASSADHLFELGEFEPPLSDLPNKFCSATIAAVHLQTVTALHAHSLRSSSGPSMGFCCFQPCSTAVPDPIPDHTLSLLTLNAHTPSSCCRCTTAVCACQRRWLSLPPVEDG
jgi:hypothetical protein